MSPAKTKICGITDIADAKAAATAGADAVGAVFSPGYAPYVTPDQGRNVFEALPPFVCRVALFVDPEESLVNEIIRHVRPSLLQFHGNESSDFCTRFSLPYVKACRATGLKDIIDTMNNHAGASGYLLDGFSENAPGGTGTVFDWSLAAKLDSNKPVMVAGGLTPENVSQAIAACHPYAVDVSSGVCMEGNRRRKSPERIKRFIDNVKSCCN